MKNMFKRNLLLTATCALFAIPTAASAATGCAEGEYYNATADICVAATPDEIWLDMLDRNAVRFVSTENLLSLVNGSQPVPRQRLGTKGQKPKAIVLTCSDSRVPPEILFDSGLGELFVVRVAGNIVNEHELGSIEYAVEHLGTRLIVVLGHTKCGAVQATYDAYPSAGDINDGIGSLVASIYPAVNTVLGGNKANRTGSAAQVDQCVDENIKVVTAEILARSEIIKEYVEGSIPKSIAADTVKIVKAKYDISTGIVTEKP